MDRKMIVISDVDGCLTDGKFIYTSEGKVAKIFGAHDNDGIKLLRKNGIEVRFISADKRGFEITKKRIEDMKCEVDYVPESLRASYLARYCADERYPNGIHLIDIKLKSRITENSMGYRNREKKNWKR